MKGALKNEDGGNRCLDKMNQNMGGHAGTYLCHGQGSNQNWMLTVHQELRSIDDMCLQPLTPTSPSILISGCSRSAVQQWSYDKEKHTLAANDGRCLEVTDGSPGLRVAACAAESRSQRWIFVKM